MAIDAGNVYSELVLDTTKFYTGLSNAENKANKFGDNMISKGKKMESVGKGLTMGLTVPIIGIGTAAATTAAGFEASMSEVAAISGATGDDLKSLEDIAREMGATTKFSASESAEALKFMSMAGWTAEQSVAGLPGVLALAAASGEDLATTSDIVTDAMTAFGLQAEESGHFADVLAAASSSANTNVGIMGETFKYAAPIAGALGYSVEDTALAIGQLANSGIKGSQAGTALRTIFNKMTGDISVAGEAIGEVDIQTQNADGSMRDFSDVLVDMRSVWDELSEAEQAQNAKLIFGQEAMSGFLALMAGSDADFDKLQGNIENSTGKAQEMSDVMQDNLQGEITKLKSAMEGLAIDFGKILIPALSDVVEKTNEGVTWFSELDEETKEMIITAGKFAAAIGPVVMITGKLSQGIGSTVNLVSKLSGGAGLATKALGAGSTGLGGAMAGTLGTILPWGIAIAGAGTAAYGLYKYLNEDVVPEVDIFGETVSENTKEAVGGFLDLEKEGTAALMGLKGSGARVTSEMSTEITGNIGTMAGEVIGKLEQQKIDAIAEIQEMFDETTDISEEEKEEMIRIATEKYDESIAKTQRGHDRITEIFELAAEENRKITDKEWIEITAIRENMKEDGIRLLSETQEESETILENLKANSERLTLEMASEVIKNSIKQKDESIAAAEEEYNKRIQYAQTLKEEGSAESIELANKIIEEAERQKKDAIFEAQKMHQGVLDEVKAQGADVIEQIDLDNGEIKSNWETLTEWFEKNPIVRKIKNVIEEVKKTSGGSLGNYSPGLMPPTNIVDSPTIRKPLINAMGTDFFEGGRTWVGEHGPEIVELPRGSKIYSNDKSENMTNQGRTINQYIEIHSQTALSPSEIARKNLQVSRQLAMEWGV
jgi:TP901 family phage tail tape measure protein